MHAERLLFVIVAVAATSLGVVNAAGWAATSEFPIAGGGILSVTIDDTAYFLNSLSGEATAYNGNTHNYTYFPSLIGRSGGIMAAAGRKVVIAGGSINSQPAPISIFDVDTRVWIANATFSTPTIRGSDFLYFACSQPPAGGSKSVWWSRLGDFSVTYVDVYDGATNTWTAVTLPDPGRVAARSGGFAGGSAGNDRCVIAGGSNPLNEPIATADVYTFSTGAYDANVTALSVARGSLSTASFGTKLIFVGGEADSTQYNTIDIYDAQSNAWSVAPVALATARERPGVGYIAGLIFIAGGRSPSGVVATVEVYNLTSGVISFTQPLGSGRRTYMAVARAGTQLLFAAGDTGDDGTNAFDLYESSYCAGANPCMHGGTCASGISGYTCACAAPYTGANCQIAPASGSSTGSAAGTGAGAGSSGTISGAGRVVARAEVFAAAVVVVVAAAALL